MIRGILFLILGLFSFAQAQENIIDNSNQSVITLNEELRKQRRSIQENADTIDLAAHTIPTGVIVMWSGSIATIPSGWELCDGTCSITCPDLRDRFIVGATQDDSGVAKSNVLGSLAQTSDGQVIAHTHLAGTLISNFQWRQVSGVGSGAWGYMLEPTFLTGPPGDKADFGWQASTINNLGTQDGGVRIVTTGSTASYGTGTKNIAIFYALAYIIKN
jgi:hypothetical protein